jgi:hypothetical protein
MTLTLPAIDPAEAELRRVALAALNGVRVDGLVLYARIDAEPERRGDWLRFHNGAALAVDRLDGVPLRLDAGDGVGAAAAIERAEPLVAAIEAALGLTLDPDTLVAEPGQGVIVTIDHGGASRLRLSLPTTLALLPARPDFAPELIAALSLPAMLSVEGPKLAPHDAASLAPGDLLLLGGASLPARLTVAGQTCSGRFDAARSAFHIHSIGAS